MVCKGNIFVLVVDGGVVVMFLLILFFLIVWLFYGSIWGIL